MSGHIIQHNPGTKITQPEYGLPLHPDVVNSWAEFIRGSGPMILLFETRGGGLSPHAWKRLNI